MKSLLAVSIIALHIYPVTSAKAETTELISLSTTLRNALRQNPDLKSQREGVEIRRAQVRGELLDFEWGVEALARYEDRSKPQNTREFIAVGGVSLPGDEERIFVDENLTSRIGLTKKYTTGTVVELGSRYSRLENTLNRTSASSLYSPEYETFTGLTLTQPLLRGFGRSANLAGVDIARHEVSSQELLTRLQAMNIVAEVASSYIDVVAADRLLSVRGRNVALAEQMLEQNRELLESKEGLEADVVAAELVLYQRQDQYINAAVDKVARINALFALIDRGPDLDSKTRFKPSNGFFSDSSLKDKRELISYGQDQRLDVAYYEGRVEIGKIIVLRARDSTKPELNLTGTAGVYGLSDDGNGAYREAADAQGTEWSIGFNFKMPLGRENNTAAIDEAMAQLRQAEIDLSKTKRKISLEVDTAWSRVDAAKKRIAASKKANQLARKRVQQEQDLFKQGEGDFNRVIEQQEILANTDENVVLTEAALSKSVINVWLASGQIFNRLGISDKDVEVALMLANQENN